MAANKNTGTDARQRTLLICVVTNGRQDASLTCASTLLRLQMMMMTASEPTKSDVHFVATTDDALNILWRHPTAFGAVLLDAACGVDPEFVKGAMSSELSVVVAPYALPGINWERVKKAPKSELPQYWGNTYSVKVSGKPGNNGYVHVEDARLGVAWVHRHAVQAAVVRHPEIVGTSGENGEKRAAFAVEGVMDGRRLTADQHFLAVYGGDVYADVDHAATSSGPVEFGGCVGLRTVLR